MLFRSKSEVEQLFKTPESIVPLKKHLWGLLLKKHFPNVSTEKIDPLMALIILESANTINAVREAKQFIAEKQFLKGDKDVKPKA